MDVFAHEDYKKVIKLRVKELQETRKGLTLQKIASQVPVQYTYLSKSLNDSKTHLNEDHLFVVCGLLEFFGEEIDYVFLLRSLAIAISSKRQDFLRSKIERARKARQIHAPVQDFNLSQLTQEMSYLFDPLCVIVHVSLHIDEFFQSPKKLCANLGLTVNQLQETLRRLAALNFIELESDGFRVRKLLSGSLHYGTDHPLMRVHQNLMRTLSGSQLMRLPESDKHGFMVTFTASPATFEKIKQEFAVFMKQVEQMVGKSRYTNTYQLNFDLFRWM